MPSRPGQALASAISASMSNLPSGAWEITPEGAPPSRMRRVRRRVSTPLMPTSLYFFSQPSRCCAERQFEGSVISAEMTQPRAAGSPVSRSSGLGRHCRYAGR
jgi:hypothetical protein